MVKKDSSRKISQASWDFNHFFVNAEDGIHTFGGITRAGWEIKGDAEKRALKKAAMFN